MSSTTSIYSKDGTLSIWFNGDEVHTIQGLREKESEYTTKIASLETEIKNATRMCCDNNALKTLANAISKSKLIDQNELEKINEDDYIYSEEYIQDLLDEYYSYTFKLSRVLLMLHCDNLKQTETDLNEQNEDPDYWSKR